MTKEVKCEKCSHEWNYKGESKHYVTCPSCLRKTKVYSEGGE